ncbi:ferredoxin [Gandjariella thermophila]|uniref:Ferredoxin n=1 Tax=Gandjariella thermophila TaxID=1931992 RepID=A0A4D4J3Y1_9PSEU|nr:ferredoxin [Gandjariella thermophila]GDY29782.1 ferredoxin [Gandjariella thermophila]
MKIEVDYDACEANGVCEAVAPEVFHVDDEDNLNIIADPTPQTADKVRQAVQSCPKAALSLRED